jgi:putative transposase
LILNVFFQCFYSNSSTTNAGWGEFIEIVTCKAASAGKITVAVKPNGTTQLCCSCGAKVPKDLSVRWHSCCCGVKLSRDHNAAINVKNRAEGHPVLKAQLMSYAVAGVAEKPTPSLAW